jgi:hypothetical protein
MVNKYNLTYFQRVEQNKNFKGEDTAINVVAKEQEVCAKRDNYFLRKNLL